MESIPVHAGERSRAYATAALREETRLVATARPGTRNDTLNRAAFNLGQLVAAGMLPAPVVISGLAAAAETAGLPAAEARRTITSGLAAGSRRPRLIAGHQERRGLPERQADDSGPGDRRIGEP